MKSMIYMNHENKIETKCQINNVGFKRVFGNELKKNSHMNVMNQKRNQISMCLDQNLKSKMQR